MKKLLDHSPRSKPLYAQVYDILVKKLHNGEYRQDQAFPTEAEFQEMFGISRITARRALSELEKEGYLSRKAGIGTQVIRNSRRAFATVHTQMIGSEEHKAERQIISLAQVPADETVSKMLNIQNGERVTRMVRVIRNPQRVIQYNDIFLSPVVGPVEEQDIHSSLLLFLEERGCNTFRYSEWLSAALAEGGQIALLGLERPEPLLIKTRVGYSEEDVPLYYMVSGSLSAFYEYRIDVS